MKKKSVGEFRQGNSGLWEVGVTTTVCRGVCVPTRVGGDVFICEIVYVNVMCFCDFRI